MPTTLKMQNIFYCEANKKYDKKTENLSVRNYSPPQSQYFVGPPIAAITAASILGYPSINSAHLANGIYAHYSRQNCPAPSSLIGSAGVQQSLSHTTDAQLD